VSDEISTIDTELFDEAAPDFQSLGLDPRLIEILTKQGITSTFPIQAQCIPLAVAGRDILAKAKTGSGKTLAFALPALNYMLKNPANHGVENHQPEILVLCPTRELCIQVSTVINELGSSLGVKTVTIYGGAASADQVKKIAEGFDVAVATPGRLIDLVNQREINLAQVKMLILDEADEMLDIGFIDAVESILAMTDSSRQTMLFSATMPGRIIAIGKKYMQSPTRVAVEDEALSEGGTANIAQHVWRAHQMDKTAIIEAALLSELGKKIIIFSRTKRNAQRICDDLVADGYKALTIHGDMQQVAREKALAQFTEGKGQVLVATDVAARGIHVDGVTLVINYDCPDDERSYTHRIGRTGRAGEQGTALTLVDWADVTKWAGINGQLNGDLPNDPPEVYSTSAVAKELFPRVHEKPTRKGPRESELKSAAAKKGPAKSAPKAAGKPATARPPREKRERKVTRKYKGE